MQSEVDILVFPGLVLFIWQLFTIQRDASFLYPPPPAAAASGP